jgi:hypothetical protein
MVAQTSNLINQLAVMPPPFGGCMLLKNWYVPYGNRTRVAAVKEKRFTGMQRKPAAWIAP